MNILLDSAIKQAKGGMNSVLKKCGKLSDYLGFYDSLKPFTHFIISFEAKNF